MPRPKNDLLRDFFETDNGPNVTCTNEKCNKILNDHAGNLERHLKTFHPRLHDIYVKKKSRELLSKTKTNTVINLSCTVNKKHLEMAFIELFTKCGRPLHLAEDRPFKMIVSPILNGLNINLDKHNIMENIAEFSCNLKREISEELRGRLISLKIDAATRLSVSVLCINVQYIKDNSIIMKTLAIKQLNQRHTSDCLTTILLEVLSEYDISLNQVFTITTDNGANMVKAVTDLNDDIYNSLDELCGGTDLIDIDSDLSLDGVTNIQCVAQALQLCVIDVIQSADILEKLEVIRRVVLKLRTQPYLNLLKSDNYKMPILDTITRLNSTYLMVERFMELKEFIEAMNDDNAFFDVSNEIWAFAADFVKVFNVLYTTSKKLQSENLIYSDFYIEITNIILQLDNLPNSDLKLYLTESLNTRKSVLFENDLFVAAIFLDPRIKVCLTSDQCARAKSCLKELYKRLLLLREETTNTTTQTAETKVGITSISSSIPSTASSSNRDPLEEYFMSFEQVCKKETFSALYQIEEDLLTYERQSRLGIKVNIIDFWSRQRNSLSEIAEVVLGIPCNQVSVERLFSALKYILADQRNKLSSTNLEHILLVKANGDFIYD